MSYDLPGYEGWDCPTCMRPMEKEDDHECSTCGMNASEHLSVTSLCRILREVSGREAALIVERDKLQDENKALQEQLDAAIMLGKMQERRHARELEQVREQYRLSSVCRRLLDENKQLKGDP